VGEEGNKAQGGGLPERGVRVQGGRSLGKGDKAQGKGSPWNGQPRLWNGRPRLGNMW
jgi:hypothetical protein